MEDLEETSSQCPLLEMFLSGSCAKTAVDSETDWYCK